MTPQEFKYRIELEKLRIERKNIELEIQRERNRNGQNMQAVLLAELAAQGAKCDIGNNEDPSNQLDRLLVEEGFDPSDELFSKTWVTPANVAQNLDLEVGTIRSWCRENSVICKQAVGRKKEWLICPKSAALKSVKSLDPRLEARG